MIGCGKKILLAITAMEDKGTLSDLVNENTFSGIEGYADENEGTYVFSYEITNA